MNLETQMEERADLEHRVNKLEQKVPMVDGNLDALQKSTDESHKKFLIGQDDNHRRSTKSKF